jgi:hypothetical protein
VFGTALVAFVATGITGCNSEYIYGRQFAQRSLTPRSMWKAAGPLRDPAKAVDGDSATAAVTEGSYGGAALDIDLGEVCFFNMVAIAHGPDETGFCARVAVETSLDGKDFSRWAEVPGTRRVTFVNLITPVLARYVRLKVVAEGSRPWSVAEVHLQ